jgi:hypothetical protein
MRIPEQVWRLGVVVGVVVAVVLATRFLVIPASLVSTAVHRSTTVEREVAKPVRFAGSPACQECHDDVAARKAKSFHRGLACEGCHGAAAPHAEDPGAQKPSLRRDRTLCPACHAYDPARPTGFPQINPVLHNPLKPCAECHDPHAPDPPTVPKECAACHAQIERTKAVSSHARIECVTCHRAPEAHKKTPRAVLPSKPQAREFCGTCHAKGAARPESPKVDVTEHGGRFLCWECHYPHLPEGRT